MILVATKFARLFVLAALLINLISQRCYYIVFSYVCLKLLEDFQSSIKESVSSMIPKESYVLVGPRLHLSVKIE